MGLAQTVEVFASTYGVSTAFDMAAALCGRWFEPALVDALSTLWKRDHAFWQLLAEGDVLAEAARVTPRARVIVADDDVLDEVAEAFARVIDAKSPWTYQHSNGVATLAMQLGSRMGLTPADLRTLKRAALMHDLGKLGVSNLILDKPGRLTDEELSAMRQHPRHTREILSRVGCFIRLRRGGGRPSRTTRWRRIRLRHAGRSHQRLVTHSGGGRHLRRAPGLWRTGRDCRSSASWTS